MLVVQPQEAASIAVEFASSVPITVHKLHCVEFRIT